MKDICNYSKCTGCFTCQNLCPNKCIQLKADKHGELHPVIETNKCTECGLCYKRCPANASTLTPFLISPDCYAAWNEDLLNRKLNASGGIAEAMCSYVIEKLGGVVYGVKWDKFLRPVFDRIDNVDDLQYLRGSKYVQAFVDNNYSKVRMDLLKGLFVLFIGTPCQVAGLKSYLSKKYENLITCDLLCHGVPPYDYFSEELKKITYRGFKDVNNCRFRGNDDYNYSLSLWNGDKLVYTSRSVHSYYFLGFLTSIILRESCYTCCYSTDSRVSDITIGDFLGLGKLKTVEENPLNVSVVVTNTESGSSFWTEISKYNVKLKVEKREYAEAVAGGQSLRKSATRNSKRNKFLANYELKGYNSAIHNVLWKSILLNMVLFRLKRR